MPKPVCKHLILDEHPAAPLPSLFITHLLHIASSTLPPAVPEVRAVERGRPQWHHRTTGCIFTRPRTCFDRACFTGKLGRCSYCDLILHSVCTTALITLPSLRHFAPLTPRLPCTSSSHEHDQQRSQALLLPPPLPATAALDCHRWRRRTAAHNSSIPQHHNSTIP